MKGNIFSSKKQPIEIKEDENPKKNKNLLSYKRKRIKNNYGKYSGIVDENGRHIDNPTIEQSVKTMIQYLNKNTPESNVYRPEHAHRAVNYNRKAIKTLA